MRSSHRQIERPTSLLLPEGAVSMGAGSGRAAGAWRGLRLLACLPFLLLALGCSQPDEEPCLLEENGDGTWTMRCPDGSSATFHPAPKGEATGTVKGVVRRLGLSDNGGIGVTLRASDPTQGIRRSLSQRDGSYEFSLVPPGIYTLTFSDPSYPIVSRRQHPVLPGTLELATVMLRATERITTTPASLLVPAPEEDAFLALEEVGGSLHLWEEGAGETTLLSLRAASPEFLPDGSGALYLDSYDDREEAGTLLLYDRRLRRALNVASNAKRWANAGERSLVVEQTHGKLSVWREGKLETILESGTLGWTLSPDQGRVVALGKPPDSNTAQVLLWEIAAGTGSVLARAGAITTTILFDGEGRSFLFRGDAGLMLWDGREERLTLLPGAAEEAVINQDGSLILLILKDDRLRLYDVATREQHVLSNSRSTWRGFDPRTLAPFFIFEELVPSVGRVYSLGTWGRGKGVVLLEEHQDEVSAPLFPEGSDAVIFGVTVRTGNAPPEPTTEGRVRHWTPAHGTKTVARFINQGPVLARDHRHLLYRKEAIEILDLESMESVSLGKGFLHATLQTHASGLLHFATDPLYRDGTSATIGPICIYEMQENERHVVADEVWHQSCRFSQKGGLLCLSRRSPIAPHGSQLLEWHRDKGQFSWLSDGVLSFVWGRDGDRAAFLSQPREGSETPLLWLHQPSLSTPHPIDDGVKEVLLASRWLAYSVPTGQRKGVYVSSFPLAPKKEESNEE